MSASASVREGTRLRNRAGIALAAGLVAPILIYALNIDDVLATAVTETDAARIGRCLVLSIPVWLGGLILLWPTGHRHSLSTETPKGPHEASQVPEPDTTDLSRLDMDRAYSAAVAASLQEGICIQDADGKIVDLNPAAARILGGAHEDLLGKNSRDFEARCIHPDGTPFPASDHPATRCLASGEPVLGAVMGLTGGGPDDTKWIRIDAHPIVDADMDRPIGSVTSFTDITAARRAEYQLLDALWAISDGFALWDHNDRLVICNDQYRGFYPKVRHVLTPGKLYSDFLQDLIDNDVCVIEEGPHIWKQGILDKHRRGEGEYELLLTDGRVIRVADRRTSDGGIVSIRTDITNVVHIQQRLAEREHHLAVSLRELDRNARELARFANELERERDRANAANRAKSQFLATMSHELRTPLNAIMGFSEVIKSEMLGPVENNTYRQYAADIHGSAEHLLSLINDILDVSKIEAGRYDLYRESFDLPKLFEEIAALCRTSAEDRGILLNVSVAPGLTDIFADRRAIKQVMINLATNAMKFTDTGGRIDITAVRENDTVVLAVADTGIGIPLEEQAHILEPFVQFQREKHRSMEGTGLGLALSKALTELHGGRLDLESEPGEGTTVTLRLPLALDIGWIDSLKTGVAELDDEHRKLFDAIEAFVIETGHADTVPAALQALDRLESVFSAHFQVQDQLLERLRIPDLTRHRLGHEKGLTLVAAIRSRIDDKPEFGDPHWPLRLATPLINWLLNHLIGLEQDTALYSRVRDAALRSSDDTRERPLPTPA